MSSSNAVVPIDLIEHPETYEREHVHQVYDRIASHFSSTRYKPWPIVARFLHSLPPGWVGLDSGTGNGKYLPLPLDCPGRIWTIGLDRSRNLLEVAKNAGGINCVREVVVGDVLASTWRAGIFDYAISIATIHHLSTLERRKRAVQSMLQCLSPSHGRALIYVWAIQQDSLSKRVIPVSPSLCDSAGKGRDVFVPWISSQVQGTPPLNLADTIGQDGKVGSESLGEITDRRSGPQIFNRYYHMFEEGELRELVAGAAEELGITIGSPVEPAMKLSSICPQQMERGLEIVQDGWERSNYFIELRLWEACLHSKRN